MPKVSQTALVKRTAVTQSYTLYKLLLLVRQILLERSSTEWNPILLLCETLAYLADLRTKDSYKAKNLDSTSHSPRRRQPWAAALKNTRWPAEKLTQKACLAQVVT